MTIRVLFLFFLLISSLCEAKPPQLNPRDARLKIEEILKSHASYHSLSQELMKRALGNYIDELDPSKCYFLKEDIESWLEPSETLLLEALNGYKKEDFSLFHAIHQQMIVAIERRSLLEKEIEMAALPDGVRPSEFKEIKWATTKEELKDRLLRIKALQLETAEKIDPKVKTQFIERLHRRRMHREEELTGNSPEEQKKVVLSLVLKSISSALDSQTSYFTPSEANQFLIQVQQRLFGIGAQLRDDFNGLTIVRLLDGGPARLNGKIKEGDRIIAVNKDPIVGMDITEAVELIRGQQGTTVQLTILREDKVQKVEDKLEIDIVRGEVVLKESRLETSYEPYADGVIGVLHLFSFYQDSTSSSASDLYKAIESLKKEHHLKGIILDLRSNGGGILQQAVAVTGLFIKKGVVVSVKDNTGEVQKLRNIDGKLCWNGPLIVLVDRASASAAEIVAQTLQDYGRALIVGDERTYGKGTFQTFTLEAAKYAKVNPKGEYKVTRGRYYTVSGKSPQLVGVKSDVVVAGPFSHFEFGEKFAKFPLENDQIDPSFEDDLKDIPSYHRNQVLNLYKSNLQTVLSTYNPHLELISQNSALRIKQNKNYQNFLKQISNDPDRELVEPSKIESFGQTDLQLEEAVNIAKDLIFLLEQEKRPAA